MKIVILAAGSGSRLGGSKPLARVHGLSMLRRTARLVAPLAAHRYVITPPRAVRLKLELRGLGALCVENPLRAEGLSSSIRVAVKRASPAAAILFLPADLPELKARELCRLIVRWRSTPRRVVGRRLGATAATPLILPARLFPLVYRLRGDTGLRAVVSQLEKAQFALVDMPSAALDVDTPEALSAARARWRGR